MVVEVEALDACGALDVAPVFFCVSPLLHAASSAMDRMVNRCRRFTKSLRWMFAIP
jgi:hypothetical protein